MAVGRTILDEWKEQVDNFSKEVDKSLEEVRRHKLEIEQLKQELLNEIHNGQYIRDDQCIVISAPKIIIGNVGKDGTLLNGSGEITIRGQKLEMDGVGEGGSLTMCAPVINQIAKDTGIDGLENVVYKNSSIVTMASSILLDSQSPVIDKDNEGTFMPSSVPANGIKLSSEKGIEVMAAPQNTTKKTDATRHEGDLNNAITNLRADIALEKTSLEGNISRLKGILDNAEKLNLDEDLTRTNVLAIDELAVSLKEELPILNNSLLEYIKHVSEMAELTREKKLMKAEKDQATDHASDYKKSTGAGITLQSEKISLLSKDGEGEWRTNDGAGVDIHANDIKLQATEDNEKLTANGHVTIHSRNVKLTTADPDGLDYQQDHSDHDKVKLKTGKFPLVGDVTIQSKTINMESIDLEQTDFKKQKEEKLTKDGAINMRAKKVRIKTIDQEGKCDGRFSVNSKNIVLKSADIDEYKAECDLDEQGNRKIDSTKYNYRTVTKDSKMLLLTDKMSVGNIDTDQIHSSEINIAANDKLIVASNTQTIVNAANSGIFLKKDEIDLATDAKIFCTIEKSATTISNDAKFESKLEGTDITANNITAKKFLKGPKTADGTNIPSKPSIPKSQSLPDLRDIKDLLKE